MPLYPDEIEAQVTPSGEGESCLQGSSQNPETWRVTMNSNLK
jgi:hypothetical protein